MKKLFIFAAIAAAGLLTSCSSDDNLAADEGQNPLENSDGQVAIKIGVGSPAGTVTTRGTGTAGGTNAYVDNSTKDPNIWRGERVHVLMYKVNEDASHGLLPSFVYSQTDGDSPENLYDASSLLVTPLEGERANTGIAKEPVDPSKIGLADPQNTFKVKYYPINGQSDFWGYYLGGYGEGADAPAGDGAVTMYEDANLATSTTTEASANYVATHFTIDGSHDLLVGNAKPAGTWTPATEGSAFAYSAKAARKGLQPTIDFKHLLTRLQFQAIAGKANAAGVRVKAIKVYSKITGDMIVAYKYKNALGEAVAEPNNRIVWDANYDNMSYDGNAHAATEATYAWVGADETDYTNSNDQQDLTGTVGTDVDAADAVAGNVGRVAKLWLVDTNGNSNMDEAEVTYKKVVQTAPAIPETVAGMPQVSLKRRIAVGDVIPTTYKATDASGTYADETAYDGIEDANKAGKGSAVDLENAKTAANLNKYFFVTGDKVYKIEVDQAEKTIAAADPEVGKMLPLAPITLTWADTDDNKQNDETELKPVGEALIVAPMDKYSVVVEYDMDAYTAQNWYSNTTPAADPRPNTPGDFTAAQTVIPGKLIADLIRTGTGSTADAGDPFVAGESYLITITLYGPEQIVITTKLTAWQKSDQDIAIGADE